MKRFKKSRLCIVLATAFMSAASLISLIKYQQNIADFVFARTGRVKAALTGVTLNNGNSNVVSGNDITSQTTALSPDIGAYKWTVNGANYGLFSMPFDADTAQTDTIGTNTGTATNGAVYTTSGCKVGGCISLDGTDDYVAIAQNTFNGLTNFTVEGWVKLNTLDSPTDGQSFISALQNGVQHYMSLLLMDNGNVEVYLRAASINCSLVVAHGMTAGQWHHLVFTKSAGTLTVFRDGSQIGQSVTSCTGAINTNTGTTRIGAHDAPTAPGSRPLNGNIDEVRIYNRVLSGAQVTQNYTDGLGSGVAATDGVGGPTSIDTLETSLGQLWDLTVTPITTAGSVGSPITTSNQAYITNGTATITGSFGATREDVDLAATVTVPSGSVSGLRWSLNGSPWATLSLPFNSGATHTDVSGNAYTVTNQGNAAYTSSGCKVGGCLLLDGNDDYSVIGTTAPLLSLTALTVSAWANGSGTIISNHVSGSTWESLILDTSVFVLNAANNTTNRKILSYPSIAGTGWHHVVGVWNGSNMYVYTDGALVAGPLSNTLTPWANPNGAYIGANQSVSAAPADGEFTGRIDELQIYRRALTLEEITILYQDGLGSGLASSDGVGGPRTISLREHAFGQTWQLLAYEIFNTSGDVGGPVFIGSSSLAAAAVTTITPTTPSGTQNRNITITYTCSNADNTPRDLLVDFSTNGGGAFSNASLVSSSSGTISGSTILNATCNGSSQSLVWNSLANVVASGVLDADVRIRITAQINAAPSGQTANFSVQNPFIFSTPTTITSADTSYDNTDILCVGTTLTINGAHPFTGLELINGCTLTHGTNTTTQTNFADLTISGNANIDATSSINLNGKGYQGGQACNTTGAGPGGGPLGTNPGSGASFPQGGASYGGRGGSGNNTSVAASYGSMSAPNELGSGGAGGGFYNCSGSSTAGGSGGGLLVMSVAGTLTLDGIITSNGNVGVSNGGSAGGGSGGGVWLDVGTLAGNGTISANGGNPSSSGGGSGGGGRIAVYYDTNNHSNLAGSVFAAGGATTNAGSAGTIYLKPNADNFGDLVMTNNNVAGQYTTSISGVTQFDTITILNAANIVYTPATLELDETLTIGGATSTRFALSGTTVTSTSGVADIVINNNGILSHDLNTTARTNYIDIAGIQDVTINSGGSINVDGRGYRGGTTRCQAGAGTGAGLPGTDPGSGASFPSGGASYGGRGGTGNNSNVAPSYGSPTQPTDLGSGGAGGGDYLCDGGTTTGGAGGGAIKIVGTGTLTVSGTISANGSVGVTGVGQAGGGAGGSIWLDFGTITGSNTITANGGNASSSGGGAGGGGRIALYYTTNSHASLSTSTTARGGSLANAGGAGTIYFKPSGDNFGDLQFSNGGTAGQYTTLFTGATQFDTVTVLDAASIIYQPTTLEIDELITIGGTASTTFAVSDTSVTSTTGTADIVINNNGILSHDTNTTTHVNDLDVSGFRHATINAGGSINVVGKGYRGGTTRCQNGAGPGGGRAGTDPGSGSAFPSGGGIYGGRGGNGNNTNFSTFYGSITAPSDLGSGGAGGGDYGCDGGTTVGGAGGGFVKLFLSGTLTINGSINANGGVGTSTVGQAGGGSGGSLWLNVDTITGSGTITADGGNASSVGGGSGGGGRIAIVYNTNSHTNLIGSISIAGGSISNYGSSGTAYVKQNSLSNGDLKLDNNTFNSVHVTNLFVTGQPTTYTFRDLYVIEFAELHIDTPCAGLPALTVTGSTYLTGSGAITNGQPGTCTVSQPAINITTTTLPAGVIGSPYSQTAQGTGGYAPYTWVCRNGGVTVACSTVLPPGLSMSSAGVFSGTPTTFGVYPFTVRATEASSPFGTDDQALSISVGNAPTAPTTLFVHNTDAQVGNTTPSGIDGSPVFSAIFNDPDTGETATKYRIQVASDAGFTTVLWESGASGTAIASCAISARCANINYAGSALSLNGTTYHWRIKFWDSLDIEGAFSATNTFVTDAAPTAPTALFSNDSSAQTGLTNPVGVLASHPVFSAIYNDPDGSDTATKYRIQVDNNNTFSSPVWDSGAAGTSMASCNQGVRCADIVFGGTDLSADETVYFWRIKFWDAAGVESAWSEDPTATNKFTMGLIGSNPQSGNEPPPQATVPETPIAGAVQVLDANSVRYNWIDTSNNETGFRILNAEGNVIADVLAGVNQAVETNLPANSLVDGRKVLAYNSQGQSPAAPFSAVVTSAPRSRPVLVRRGGNSVTFTIEPAFSAGFPGQTAVRYELLVTDSQGVTRTITSEWIQQNEYTFEGVSADDRVEVRVITRNQVSLQNEPTEYENVAELSRRFAVNIGVFEKGTNSRPSPINPNSILSVSMRIESIGSDPASSVVLNLPLPRYVLYRTGTMSVDGRIATDGFDGDAGQADQNGVAASWARMNPGESHSVAFELAFDVLALQQLRASQESVAQALAQALAAANPIINLQASVSFAESDVVYMSPVITMEPDLGLTEVPVVPEEEPEALPPEPEFIEEPVPLPTPEETQIIEQILQQEFGSPPAPSETGGEPTLPAPVLQTGETITSSDAGTFNVDVTSGDNALGLTGSAQVSEDSIKFTGTTTQPFTVITLIFNDSITAIAVSDANGFWQTFVSADRLGIEPGQEATVKIEAIAAKGDLRSERVSVGDVVVSRGRGGDIAAEFDTTVSDSVFLSVAEEIQHQVVKVIENQEPVIQTTLSVAAPVVVVSSVPLWGYLPYAPTMIYHFITYAVGAIGRKKKMAARFYGVAYDSISKQPLALAIIRIYKVEPALPQAASVGAAAASNKKLVTTVVTDKAGRYDALLEPGQYTLEVAKPGYMFPSQIVTLAQDGNFQNVYNGGQGIKVEGETLTIPDVPLDPVNAARQWQLATGPKKLWYSMQKVGGYLAIPILIVGAVMSAAVVATIPDKPINWIIAVFYIVLLSLQIKLRQKVEKAWGVVYDIATNAVLPLTTIQLIEPASSKVVTSRLSDYQGRFSFLPEPGKYVIKATRQGYAQVEVIETPSAERQPLKAEITIEQPDQRISGDIAMRQAI